MVPKVFNAGEEKGVGKRVFDDGESRPSEEPTEALFGNDVAAEEPETMKVNIFL